MLYEVITRHDLAAWSEEIEAMILDHHKLRPVTVAPSPLVERRPFDGVFRSQLLIAVITSYSIHYTKLYEPARSAGTETSGMGRRLAGQQGQQVGNAVAHLATIDDHVDGALLEQEFSTLEPLGQRLANGLFDHARTGEALV